MKLFVVAAILGVCVADRLDNKYLPPRGNSGAGFSNGGFGAAPAPSGFKSAGGFGQGNYASANSGFGGGQGFNQGSGFGGAQHAGNAYNAAPQQYNNNQYSSRQNSADAGAQILRQNSEVTAEGFSYDFETSNGIRADASGVATNGVQSHGSFGYKGDDGQDYSITYTADENGYQPQGAHLPTPPPIPEAILKSLEQNARDEAAGISDDGSYHGEGAGAGGANGYPHSGPSAPSSQYGAPSRGSNFGGSSHFGGAANAGGAPSFGGSSNFGKASNGGASNFASSAASRQYLAPNVQRGSGNGNFNQQSGYRY